MMPGMAFAAEGDATSGSITGTISASDTVYIGAPETMDELTFTANGDVYKRQDKGLVQIRNIGRQRGQRREGVAAAEGDGQILNTIREIFHFFQIHTVTEPV